MKTTTVSTQSGRRRHHWAMVRILTVLVILGVVGPLVATAKDAPDRPEKKAPDKAINLFDGKTLAGWEHFLVKPDVKMADVWSVRDGLLICKGTPLGYLATKKLYTNYRLIVEYRWAPGKKPGNSGVFVRITGKPQGLPKCVEMQLKSGGAGDIYGFHGFKVSGEAARRISSENKMVGKLSGMKRIKGNEKKPGQWNTVDVTVNGGNMTLLMNGQKVNDATGCDVLAGKIGLQSEGGEIHFRSVKLISLDGAAAPAPAKTPKPGTQIKTSTEVTFTSGDKTETATVHYLLSMPKDYNSQDTVPLIIFLHGMGERGDNLDRVAVHGPPKLVRKTNTTPFIIVSPQCPKTEWWRPEKLSKLLDHILATTKADPSRVYLTGLSMGGFGTWGWAAAEPQRFAAAIPICGGGSPKTAKQLVDLPIWVFHGGKDRVVAPSKSEAMVNAIKAAGGKKVKLTVYPTVGHDSWTETYANPEIYTWLLQHRRGGK